MTALRAICPGLLLALVAGTCRSQPPSGPFYIGADLGQASLERDAGRLAAERGEHHNLGWKLRFGYQLTRLLALEATYSDFGTHRAFAPFAIPANVNAPLLGGFATSVTGFGVSLLGRFPAGEHFHFTATAGVMRREYQTRWHQPDPYFPQPRATDGDLATQIGAGVGFTIRDDLDLDLHWITTRNLAGETEFATNAADPSMVSLGVCFRL